MNERIKELAEQCWDKRLDGLHFDQEKFAELIVREYAKVGDFECPPLRPLLPTIQGEERMTPKFTQLLEKCILDGVVLGHKRAYKYDSEPSESDINQSIFNEVLNEIHEWFDFDEAKLKENI